MRAVMTRILVMGAGGLIGSTLAKMLDRHHADQLGAQLEKGGLLLWVRTPDDEQERKAVKILKRHSADDIHLHDLPEPAFSAEGGVSHDTSFMNRLGL